MQGAEACSYPEVGLPADLLYGSFPATTSKSSVPAELEGWEAFIGLTFAPILFQWSLPHFFTQCGAEATSVSGPGPAP